LFPQAFLIASSTTSGWHRPGMEWKEHFAWIAPIAATLVAHVMTRQRSAMKVYARLRTAVITFALVAFAAAAVAAFFGAMINKQAPVEGGSQIHLSE
jgi:Na+/proline symporter